MKCYEIDIMNEKVYVDPTFVKKASKLETKEFDKYMELRRTLPSFTFEEKKLNADKNTYKGLKEDVMEAFILFYEEGEAQNKALKEFNDTLAESVFKKNKGSYVKSWFLKKYKKPYNESSFALSEEGKKAIQELKDAKSNKTNMCTNAAAQPTT